MLRLAQGYGISDVGMAKICRKHNIPRPPRGYWANKEFGKAPPQTPLPEPENNYEIKLQDWTQQRQLSPELEQHVELADAAEKRIEVAESLRSAHDLEACGGTRRTSRDMAARSVASTSASPRRKESLRWLAGRGSARWAWCFVSGKWPASSRKRRSFSLAATRIRQGSAPEISASLRRMALNILQRDTIQKDSLRGKRLRAGWDETVLDAIYAGFSGE